MADSSQKPRSPASPDPPDPAERVTARGSRWWLNTALARLAFANTAQSRSRQGDDDVSVALDAPDGIELDLDDPAQREFGNYELRELIGRGGMGRVYRAYQRPLDREVALKLLSAGLWASPEFVDTLRREARLAAVLQHPNIVSVHEIGEHRGLIYYAMQLVRGRSLADRLEQDGPLPVREAATLLRTLAEAVDYAHRLGMLHLDLKPGNVVLDADGAPRITDFGLARRLERESSLDNDSICGTPSYMAPEQVQLHHDRLSVATDIWGLGALLYEALTAHPPFIAASPRKTIDLVIQGRVRSPRRYRRDLPRDLEAICLHCLRKHPIERYISARALADDLGRFLDGREVRVRPLNLWQRASRWTLREPKLATASLLLLVALGTGLVATTRQRLQAEANAISAHQNLWAQRHEAAWRLFEESRGYAALPRLATNLREQEAIGAGTAAGRERLRLGIAQAQMPALLDAIDVGAPVHVLALSPDGRYVALGLQPYQVALYDLANGRQRWRVKLKLHTPAEDGQLRRLRFTPDMRHLLVSEHWHIQQIRPAGYQGYRLAVADGAQTVVPDAARVGSESWSDDGRHVVVSDLDNTQFRLYQADGWRPLTPPVPSRFDQYRPGWLIAPGLAFVAVHYPPSGVAILDPNTLQPRHVLRPDRFEQRFIAWAISPDARWLALGRIDGEVLLVDPASGAQQSLVAPGNEPSWLSFSADSGRLAVSNRGGELHVFALPGEAAAGGVADAGAAEGMYYLRRDAELWGHQLDCDANVDACTALVMEWDRVTLWSFAGRDEIVAGPVLLAPEISHHSFVPRFASAIDQRRGLLATGGQDGSLRLWRLPPSPLLAPLAPTLREPVLRFDGSHLVAVDGREVWVFDVDRGTPVAPRVRLPQPVGFAALTADGASLVVSSGRELHVFDWRRGQRRFAPIVLDASPLALLLSPDGHRVVSQTLSPRRAPSLTSRLQVHDLATGRALGPAADIAMFNAEISADSRQLLVVGEDASALYALTDLQRPLRRFPVEKDRFVVGYAAFDPAHGELVQYAEGLSAGVDNRLQRWSLANGTLLQNLPLTARAENLLIRADGRIALSGNPGGTAITDVAVLLDRNGRRTPITVTRRDGLSRAQAFSPDGRVLAQALTSGVMLIDAADGTPLGPPLRLALPLPDYVAQLAFSPDGQRLVARTVLGRWLAWRLQPEGRVTALVITESELTAPLTSAAFVPPSTALRTSLRERDPGVPVPATRPPPSPWSCLPPGDAIPPRISGTPANLLDLGAHYTAPLHQVQLSAGNARPAGLGDLCTLPLGMQRLRGVDYDVRGVVELHHRDPAAPAVADRGAPLKPQQLRVDVAPGRYAGLHVLGALGNSAKTDHAGVPVAQLRWRYRDGSSAESWFRTAVTGWSAGPWWQWSEVSLAWIGAYPEAEIRPYAWAMLYETALRNPHPQRELVALELQATVPVMNDAGLVVIAMTLDPAAATQASR